MPDQYPPSIYASNIPGKGRGLFTSQAIEAGELVFCVDRPLLCVPSNPHLGETCYHCFLCIPEGFVQQDGDKRRLQACMGCKVVNYCSKVSKDQRRAACLSAQLLGYCLNIDERSSILFRQSQC